MLVDEHLNVFLYSPNHSFIIYIFTIWNDDYPSSHVNVFNYFISWVYIHYVNYICLDISKVSYYMRKEMVKNIKYIRDLSKKHTSYPHS